MLGRVGYSMFAYISRATVLLYSPQDPRGRWQACLNSQEATREVDVESEFVGMREMSFELFKALVKEQQTRQECEGTVDIIIVEMHQTHREWLKGASSKTVRLSLMAKHPQNGENTFKYQNKISFFVNFKEKPTVINFQQRCDITQRNTLTSLPASFLLVELVDQIQIFKVEEGTKTMIYRSNLNEDFHYTLLEEVLARQDPPLLQQTVNEAIDRIILSGNSQNSDLLVQDIFGKEGCSFIGLPPKLIASSLGKHAIDREGLSNTWDRLKSVLMAFAINLAKQINHQTFATRITTTLFVTHEFRNPYFLQLIQVIASHFGEIWFHPQGMAAKFVERLRSAKVLGKDMKSNE